MTKINNYPIYNLSNSHFQNVQITTSKDVSIKGQFIQFKFLKESVEYILPSGKFCFLPEENKSDFWKLFKLINGEFKKLPDYILQLNLIQITIIIINPLLIA